MENQVSSNVGYTLPSALEVHSQWRACVARSFVPTHNQSFVISAVQAALDAGLFYTTDIRVFCGIQLALTQQQLEANFERSKTEGGIFGMECYYARDYIRAQERFKTFDALKAQLKPYVGMKLGTLMFNDFKRTTSACIVELNGDDVVIEGKRGAYKVRFVTDLMAIKHAFDRAAEKGHRKESFVYYLNPKPVKVLNLSNNTNQLILV